jgi:hypothetical protein
MWPRLDALLGSLGAGGDDKQIFLNGLYIDQKNPSRFFKEHGLFD